MRTPHTGAIVAGIVGAVAAIAGLVVGLLPVAAAGGYTCGSPFAPASHGLQQHELLVSIWCEGDLGPRTVTAWLLIIGGLIAVIAAVIALRRPAKASALRGESPAEGTVPRE